MRESLPNSKSLINPQNVGFATFFNQVLHRNGVVESRLPLPVWVNEYSVSRPLWAQFFAVIHLVMAAALVVGIRVVGI